LLKIIEYVILSIIPRVGFSRDEVEIWAFGSVLIKKTVKNYAQTDDFKIL